VCTEEVFLR